LTLLLLLLLLLLLFEEEEEDFIDTTYEWMVMQVLIGGLRWAGARTSLVWDNSHTFKYKHEFWVKWKI
jgi:hypothetical protein